MKLPHVGVRALIAWVAVAAVNLAIGRSVYAYGDAEYHDGGGFLAEFVALGVVPQGAFFNAIRRHGPRRALGIGFFICSSMVAFSRVWFWCYPPETSIDPATDQLRTTSGCAVALPWTKYGEFTAYYFDIYINFPLADFLKKEWESKGSVLSSVSEEAILRWLGAISISESFLLLSIMQWIVAWTGGITTRVIVAQKGRLWKL